MKLFTNDPYWKYQWGHESIKVDSAWLIETGDTGIKVAVIDNGVDYEHPDLKSAFGSQKGYDFYENDNDPMPTKVGLDNHHGTHCAGIIGATINNEIGIAGLAKIRILAVRVGEGSDLLADRAADGICWAADNGAKVINMSFGTDQPVAIIKTACNYAYAKGCVLVAAAGNAGDSVVNYPAAYPKVIAVGALAEGDTLASFSNYGDSLELVAPGDYIISLGYDSSYWYMSGTSQAAPYVCGVIALMLSHNPNLSVETIRDILHEEAVDLGVAGYDKKYGYGKVHAYRSVKSSAIQENLFIKKIKPIAYPNPFRNYLYIKGSEANLYDCTGRLIARIKSNKFYTYKLKNGIYFIRINNTTQKLVKIE